MRYYCLVIQHFGICANTVLNCMQNIFFSRNKIGNKKFIYNAYNNGIKYPGDSIILIINSIYVPKNYNSL